MNETTVCEGCAVKDDKTYCLSCRIIQSCIKRMHGVLSGCRLDECNKPAREIKHLTELEYARGRAAGYEAGVAEVDELKKRYLAHKERKTVEIASNCQ